MISETDQDISLFGGRTLKPWENEHAKRTHVYKITEQIIPSSATGSSAFENMSETGSRDVIAKLLAQKFYAMSAAHNDRHFDRRLEPWTWTTPSFRFETAYGGQQVVGLDEYLELGKQIFGGDPSLKVEVQDLSIQIDAHAGTAEIFANQALISAGLKRKSVCVVEFRIVDEEWLIAGGKNIKGDDSF